MKKRSDNTLDSDDIKAISEKKKVNVPGSKVSITIEKNKATKLSDKVVKEASKVKLEGKVKKNRVYREVKNLNQVEEESIQKELNLYTGEPDGQFGPLTYAAVIAFQKTGKDAAGKPLVVDGKVGPNTIQALGLTD